MTITIQDILQRLNDEGYEHCFQDGKQDQIIVNNRGEIDGWFGKWEVCSRLDDIHREGTTDIDVLFADIAAAWPKKEPK